MIEILFNVFIFKILIADIWGNIPLCPIITIGSRESVSVISSGVSFENFHIIVDFEVSVNVIHNSFAVKKYLHTSLIQKDHILLYIVKPESKAPTENKQSPLKNKRKRDLDLGLTLKSYRPPTPPPPITFNH